MYEEDDKLTKVYVECCYKDKNHIKTLNGKWDPSLKSWYFMVNNDFNEDTINGFKVVKPKKEKEELNNIFTFLYLDVPYKDKEMAKEKGACWDKVLKKWSVKINDLDFNDTHWNGFKVNLNSKGYSMSL